MIELNFKINFTNVLPKSFFIQCDKRCDVINFSKNIDETLLDLNGNKKTIFGFFGSDAIHFEEKLQHISPENPGFALKLKFLTEADENIYYHANLCQNYDNKENKTFLLLSASAIEKEEVEILENQEENILGPLINNSSDFISITEVEGFSQLYSNQNFYNYLGYQYNDKKNLWFYSAEIIHTRDHENVSELRNKIKEGKKQNWEFYFRAIHMNGSIRLIHMRSIPYKRNSYGEVTHFICVLQDISSRTTYQLKFKEENFIYHSILKYSAADILVINDAEQLLYTLTKGVKNEPENDINLSDYLKQTVNKVLKLKILKSFKRALSGENIIETVKLEFEKYTIEYIPIKKGNQVQRIIIVLISKIDDSKKEQIPLLIQNNNQLKTNIRKLIRKNTSLLNQEERLRVLLDFQKSFIIRFNKNGAVTYVNNALGLFLERDPIIIVHGLSKNFIHPDDLILFESGLTSLKAKPTKSITIEFRFLINEKVLWTRWEISTLFDENGTIKEFIASGMDFTKKKEYEDTILKSQERFDLIARATNDAIWDWNILTNTVWWNTSLYQMMCLPLTTAPHINTLLKVIHPDDKEMINEKIQSALSERRSHWSGEFRCWVENKKEYRHFYNRAYLTFDTDGNPERMLGSIMDITERKNNENKYRYLHKSYELAVRAGKTGVWEFKTYDDSFTYDNSLTYVYGYSDDNLFINKIEFSKLIGHNQFVIFKRKLNKYLNAGDFSDPFEMVQMRYKKNKTKCWILSRASVLVDEYQKPIKLIGTDTDITDQKKAELQMKLAKQKIEEAMRTKENFFSVMSHEIRSPLSGIIGMNELLLRENFQLDQRRFLSAIKFSAENLMILINDILDFSKIRSGKLEFENNDFDLHMLLQNTYVSYKTQANDRNLNLLFKKSPDLPKYIKGDSTRLSQILNNLLSNAIKFTKVGAVTLDVNLLVREENKVRLIFEVTDTGIGIPVKKQKKIFEPFQQASKDTSRKFGGTGLGLSIVKNLIELQGGKIGMESKINKGTKFSVLLDFIKVNQEDIKQRDDESVHIRDFKGTKILYIEDVETNQAIMKGFAARWGIELETASDGYEGVHKIQSNEYDLVLMDLQMPGIDGYETTRRIRSFSDDFYQKVPIIALTAGLSDKIIKNVYESGMTDFLSKPVNHDKLYKIIKKHHIKPVVDEILKEKKIVVMKNEEENDHDLVKIDFSEPDRLFSNDRNSYIKFLKMSEKELINNRQILMNAILNSDIEVFRQTHHKMSGLLSLLKLYSFLNSLEESKKLLIKKEGELEEIEKGNVINSIDEYFENVLDLFKDKIDAV